MFRELNKDSPCKTCEGCLKLEGKNFNGVTKCSNYIKNSSTLLPINESENKYSQLKIDDEIESTKLISELHEKGFNIWQIQGDTYDTNEFMASFFCQQAGSKDDLNTVEAITHNPKVKQKLLEYFEMGHK